MAFLVVFLLSGGAAMRPGPTVGLELGQNVGQELLGSAWVAAGTHTVGSPTSRDWHTWYQPLGQLM